MKINNINPQLNSKHEHREYKPQFTGFADGALGVLNYLNTNQAWGANAVDFFCMVTPRTITDFGRGSAAGLETARRESMGTINDSAVGAYGTLAGMALAAGINKLYGFTNKNDIKLGSVFADSETLEMMGKIWADKIKNPKTDDPLKEFLEEALHKYEALSGDKKGEWIRFDESHQGGIDKAVEILEKEIKANSGKFSNEAKKSAQRALASALGIENGFRIAAEKGEKPHTSRYTLESIVENLYKLGKVFNKDSVKEEFKKSEDIAGNKFIKAMKNLNRNRSLMGVGIASLVGCSVQPINMWLTKRKTGSDSFVGGGKKDNSLKFKLEKLAVTAAFATGVLATIGKPKDLIKNLQFKGFTPTINQLKFIYGATIISRFMSARNDNELKESSVKDILGFVNWLILGNFVSKLVAQKLDKSLIKQEETGGILKWIKTSSLKTMEEVMHSELGKKVFKQDGSIMKFEEMLKSLPKGSKASKQIKYLTIAQLAGYLYSGLVLGVGIPKLNIYLTNRRMKKAAEKEKAASTDTVQPQAEMYSPKNMAFLAEKNFPSKQIMK